LTDQKEVSLFLDELRESGSINMWGAGKVVEEAFDITKKEAQTMTIHWMKNYGK